MNRKLGFAFGLVIGSLALASARADGVWFWGGGGGQYGYNRLVQSDRQIPYFAEFPPVYYNAIIPRSYGQSPYAYWPGPFTPHIYDGGPAMIDNPWVAPEEVAPAEEAPAPNGKAQPPAPPAKAASDRTTSRTPTAPLVVLNPYVEQNASVADR